jgi:hypothetical protein
MNTKFELKEEGDMLKFSLDITKTGKRDDDTEYQYVSGLIEINAEYGPVEYGFVFTIDVSHKGKSDQYTEYFMYLTPFMEFNEFKDLCNEKGIPVVYKARR